MKTQKVLKNPKPKSSFLRNPDLIESVSAHSSKSDFATYAKQSIHEKNEGNDRQSLPKPEKPERTENHKPEKKPKERLQPQRSSLKTMMKSVHGNQNMMFTDLGLGIDDPEQERERR